MSETLPYNVRITPNLLDDFHFCTSCSVVSDLRSHVDVQCTSPYRDGLLGLQALQLVYSSISIPREACGISQSTHFSLMFIILALCVDCEYYAK